MGWTPFFLNSTDPTYRIFYRILSSPDLGCSCMAVSLLGYEVSDLCLGKPALRCLPVSATVADALAALKRSGDAYISVWSCDHTSKTTKSHLEDCRCIGKICMVDVVCFFCREDNLSSPSAALQSPISLLLPKVPGVVRHLNPNSRFQEAIDLMLEGVQNIVIPIQSRTGPRKKLVAKPSFNWTLHNGVEFCWLTQEDVIRFLLNSIGVFSPLPSLTIESLDIIETENIPSVYYHEPASIALAAISQSLTNQISVAVLDQDNKLIGEISPFTLACHDETVAAAISTLSVGDLMSYIDCGGPPEDLIRLVKARLVERNLGAFLDLIEEELSHSSSLSSSSSSSDEEYGSGRRSGSSIYSTRMVRRSEAIVCYPWSSVVAVMIQALAHRVSYVWVIEEDWSLAGIVTFSGILKVFRQHLRTQAQD